MAEYKQQANMADVFEDSRLNDGINFQIILLIQLTIASESISKSREDRGISALRSVSALASLLTPYYDEKFLKEQETLEKQVANTESSPTETRIDYALVYLSILTKLMDRRDLLLGNVVASEE